MPNDQIPSPKKTRLALPQPRHRKVEGDVCEGGCDGRAELMRGRPPVTRARVLNYIESRRPETVAQVARALDVDRAQVYRILRALYGPNFRLQWRVSAETPINHAGLPLAA